MVVQHVGALIDYVGVLSIQLFRRFVCPLGAQIDIVHADVGAHGGDAKPTRLLYPSKCKVFRPLVAWHNNTVARTVVPSRGALKLHAPLAMHALLRSTQAMLLLYVYSAFGPIFEQGSVLEMLVVWSGLLSRKPRQEN